MTNEKKRQLRTVGRRSPRTIRKARKQVQREQLVEVTKTGMGTFEVTKTGMGTFMSDLHRADEERMKKYMAPQRLLSATRTRKTGGGRRRRSRRSSRRRRSCGCGK
jgi:hypothetical protein